MLKCTDTWRLRVFSIMPKIPDISVESQMGRSVSVPSDLNIAVGPVRPNLPFHFWQTSSLPYFSSLILCREFGKRNKTWGHYARFCFLFFVFCLFVVCFCVGIFRGSQKETHSSRLGLADSQVVVHVNFRFGEGDSQAADDSLVWPLA